MDEGDGGMIDDVGGSIGGSSGTRKLEGCQLC